MIYNQIVTWTAFAILAMFFKRVYFLSQGTQSFGLFRPHNERHIPRRLLDRFDGILRGECTRRGGAAAARVSSAPSVIQRLQRSGARWDTFPREMRRRDRCALRPFRSRTVLVFEGEHF